MANTLTKEKLIELGITDVTITGKVFSNGRMLREVHQVTKHPFGKDKPYIGIMFTDYTRPRKTYRVKYTTKKGTTYREVSMYQRYSIPLARVVLAWFNGVIESNMDADHIDGDPYNNHLSNLRAISRKQNLLNRAKTQREISIEFWKLKKEKEENEKNANQM